MPAPKLVTPQNIRSRFFEGLAGADIKAIIAAGRPLHFLAGSVIANQGHPANNIFLLTSGRARYFYVTADGRKVVLFWVPPGEIFGGAALLPTSSDYLLSTEAVKHSSVVVWDKAVMRKLVLRYPRLIENALLVTFDYLVCYRGLHISMACESASQRLAQVLVNLAAGMGRRVPEGIQLDVLNEELANEANVTPFTASRFLREWQRRGILRKSRGKLVLRSPERLLLQEA